MLRLHQDDPPCHRDRIEQHRDRVARLVDEGHADLAPAGVPARQVRRHLPRRPTPTGHRGRLMSEYPFGTRPSRPNPTTHDEGRIRARGPLQKDPKDNDIHVELGTTKQWKQDHLVVEIPPGQAYSSRGEYIRSNHARAAGNASRTRAREKEQQRMLLRTAKGSVSKARWRRRRRHDCRSH